MNLNMNLKYIMNQYIISKNHLLYFCGSVDVKEDEAAARILAENCRYFILDVEDEICVEEEISCFNCRFRRWSKECFSCTKEFPLKGESNG